MNNDGGEPYIHWGMAATGGEPYKTGVSATGGEPYIHPGMVATIKLHVYSWICIVKNIVTLQGISLMLFC